MHNILQSADYNLKNRLDIFNHLPTFEFAVSVSDSTIAIVVNVLMDVFATKHPQTGRERTFHKWNVYQGESHFLNEKCIFRS